MDITHFSGKEVIEIAIRVEENGLEYYTKAANNSRSEKLGELFLFLAEEEKKHKKIFEEFGRQLQDEKLPGVFDPYLNEESRYLMALANSRVFTDPNEGSRLANNVHKDVEILKTAIDLEKDSILFYYELQRAIRDQDKPVLGSLIDEEKNHLKKLTELQKSI
ncbi:MAG: ferritin family protein [Thermodesulfobacteriota bacterium]